jgi:hypothetical protein
MEAAKCGQGEAVLITGEAGVGNPAAGRGATRGRTPGAVGADGPSCRIGGAYRPLVEALPRASALFTYDTQLAAVRPILARVLPGWISDDDVLAPVADLG